MSGSASIALSFGDDVAPLVRRRLTYAFRIFCAVRGVVPLDAADVTLCYGRPATRRGHVALHTGYQARPFTEPALRPSFVTISAPEGGGVRAPLFHGANAAGEADWLGELFEWLSAADERAVADRDGVGRIPYAAGLHARFGLATDVPYASVAVASLDRQIAASADGLWTAGAPSPWPDTGLGVAATHDIDFLPDHPGATAARWARNVGAALLTMRSPVAAVRAAASVTSPLLGRPWLHDALRRFRNEERERGVASSWNVVCRRAHGRDPGYSLERPATRAALDELVASGAELGVHGSYTSLEAPGRLAEEYDRLRGIGHRPVGGRQHWLRYHGDGLFRELESAGALYDATAGFSATVGFRHGASFPFPPYDAQNERPFSILELPLAIMDVGLAADTRPDAWVERSRRILDEASRWTWGGVSILWHDTAIAGALNPPSLGRAYFDLLDGGPGKFVAAKTLVEDVRGRYAVAGLSVGAS